MKLRQRFFVVASALTALLAGATTGHAQIWDKYDVEYDLKFFNPLVVTSQNQILPNNNVQFRDFTGNVDMDDGVAVNIPVGFSFDYNGNTYNSVNIGVNGFITVGNRPIPVVSNNNTYLFLPNEPNNTIAPFFGDHYYRTLEPGYKRSRIAYGTTFTPNSNPNSNVPALGEFTVEWTDLNINDKSNPNSIATFQVKLIQNPNAGSTATPDDRVIIEFHYGSIGSVGNVVTQGATVGIEDSLGFSHLNGLFPSTLANGDSSRFSTTSRTSCWPPATCLPGRIIAFRPIGRAIINQWGDGDVDLTQLRTGVTDQSRFVTLNDADQILRSRTNYFPGSDNASLGTLDSVEGGPAFHGDANHNGRYTNPNNPGFFFYKVTSYDAAYILMYLAAKLPVLPWPDPLPVPAYKENEAVSTNISGVVADVANARIIGNTVRVPVVLRGSVNGAFGVEMNVKMGNGELVGVLPANGSMIQSNAKAGRVVIATTGELKDGDIVGYLEVNAKSEATINLNDVSANDQNMPSSSATLKLAGAANAANGFALGQNAPNPFNLSQTSATTINFTIGAAENVTLRVFDMLGHEVRGLVNNESLAAGSHDVKWDGRDNNGNLVANGLYYYQLTSSGFTQTVKMEVVR